MSQINISNIVNVSVSEAPAGAAQYNVSNIAIFTKETPVVVITDPYVVYKEPTSVGLDWGTTSETYLQAVAIFAQTPNILNNNGSLIVIPMLDNVATSGYFESPNLFLNISNFSGITDGAFKIKVNGGTLTTVDTLDFGTDPTLANIVSVLDAAITSLGATVTLNGQQIVITSDSTGASSAILLQAPSAGTDITGSGYLNVLGGTFVAGEAAADETVQQAIVRTKDLVFYMGILATLDIQPEMPSLANYVQTISKLLFFPSNDVAQLNASSDFDDIRSANNHYTRCLYYSVSAEDARLFAAAYASRGMATNFNASNSTTTQHLKDLKTIVGDDSITQTILTKAGQVGADIYPVVANLSKVYSNGTNEFFDDVFNLLWFVTTLQVQVFNVLATTSTKIPQTDAGMEIIKGSIRLLCQTSVNNRFVGAGSWTSPDTFGNQEDFIRNISEVGYYIYSLPINQQSQADREARIAPVVQIALKYQGAIHSSNIIIFVNK